MQYKEILENQGLKSEYRRKLADALRKIKNYHGKENESDEIIQTLIDLENWIKDVFAIDENAIPDSVESDIVENWHPLNIRRKLNDLLALTSSRYEKHLERSGLEGFLLIESDDIILPPDYRRAGLISGNENSIEDPVFQERIKQLLLLLEQNGIYSDDVVLVRGRVTGDMIRRESYVIVEIPRLNREILVCDQVAQATFVIYGIQSRNTFAVESKDELQERLGAQITRIVYRERAQWELEVIKALLKDVDVDELKKIDVQTMEGLRAEILKLKPTPQSWADMSQREKTSFKIAGMGIIAISRKFGFKEKPTDSRKNYLKFGRVIYGEEHECLQYEEKPELTLDELREEIIKQKPTPQSWADTTQKGKVSFKVAGMGLIAIATKFGIKENPHTKHKIYLELGRVIYGEEHECLQYEEKPELTLDELREEIIKQKPTPEDWVCITSKQRISFRIAGIGLWAIARRFGIEGQITRRDVYHELGRAIYGEEHECLGQTTPEQLREEIIKQKPTPQDWAGMVTSEKKSFKVAGMGIVAISTKFGIGGPSLDRHEIHLELGRAIYGEEHECLQYEEKPELTLDELREEIIKQKPTPQDWADMSQRKKKSFKVAGIGLVAISTKFGVKGVPYAYSKIYFELGRAIYGEEHECLQHEEKPDLTVEQLKEGILKLKPTPQEWADMTNKDKKSFKISGIGLRAIATKFGIEGNAISNHKTHLEFGRVIYGEEYECLQHKE